MILSGLEIEKNIENGSIEIDPFDRNKINPNSYNLSLHNELLIYKRNMLDLKYENEYKRIEFNQDGYCIYPGKVYLARTVERTKTDKFVPMLEGRSSIGRLGLFIHVTAGFGDIGFDGYWTLELSCIQPVKIYPGIDICQIYFHEIKGNYELYKSNKYQNNKDIQPSLLYKEYLKGEQCVC